VSPRFIFNEKGASKELERFVRTVFEIRLRPGGVTLSGHR